ncbi:MAG TPA: cytochrome C oxidase subunit II [Gallionellaceae bacterium]
MYQQVAWIVSCVLIALLAIAFAYVLINSSRTGSNADVAAATGRWRGRLLWGVTLLCIPIVAYSLTRLPYAKEAMASLGSIEVQARGYQWYWELSRTELPVGKPIEFQVNAADVNHGFAIYDPNMRIVTQTQAMPGVTNVLRYTFREPGTYRILCLEYCGVGHHTMMTELHLVDQ